MTKKMVLNTVYNSKIRQWIFNIYENTVDHTGQELLKPVRAFYVPLALNTNIDIEESIIEWWCEENPGENHFYIVQDDPNGNSIKEFQKKFDNAYDYIEDFNMMEDLTNKMKYYTKDYIENEKFFYDCGIESFIQSFQQNTSNKVIALRGNGLQIFSFDENNEDYTCRSIIIENEGIILKKGVLINNETQLAYFVDNDRFTLRIYDFDSCSIISRTLVGFKIHCICPIKQELTKDSKIYLLYEEASELEIEDTIFDEAGPTFIAEWDLSKPDDDTRAFNNKDSNPKRLAETKINKGSFVLKKNNAKKK